LRFHWAARTSVGKSSFNSKVDELISRYGAEAGDAPPPLPEDGELDRDEGPGKGPGDRADLRAIVEACRMPDLTARWKRLDELVDIPLFVRFMALEAMLAHWDGYSFNTNNYRVYFEPGKKARFLLHGMDQCFGDPGMSVLEHPRAMLAASVMRNPEWRKLYRRELERQLDEFDGRRLSRRVWRGLRHPGHALRAVKRFIGG
jgi:hypothetical protein